MKPWTDFITPLKPLKKILCRWYLCLKLIVSSWLDKSFQLTTAGFWKLLIIQDEFNIKADSTDLKISICIYIR